MILTARTLTLLAVILFLAGCGHRIAPSSTSGNNATAPSAQPSRPAAAPLQASPRKLVGRVLSIDAARGFVFVALDLDSPPAATTEGASLIVRTEDLRETARLRTSAYVRGRTLGTLLISGQPSLGDEVVFHLHAPEP